MEKNPRLTYVLSHTAQAPPPQKLPHFNAFKSLVIHTVAEAACTQMPCLFHFSSFVTPLPTRF